MDAKEPAIEAMVPAELETGPEAEPQNDFVPGTLDAMQDVPVRVRAVLGRARVPVGDLVRLRPGMIIGLDRRVGEPIDILVNDRLIARGEVVLIDNALGVTLTEIVRSEQ